MPSLEPSIRYPLSPALTAWDKLAIRLGFAGFGRCTVCGAFARFTKAEENLRESCVCSGCGSSNRHRQIARIACAAIGVTSGQRIISLRRLSDLPGITVYNTEASGPIHHALRTMPGYHCSEYFGPDNESGASVNGVIHQDLMHVSLEGDSIDLVISSDVFEHIPRPYEAHAEIYRVLRRQGRHIFTVPFHQTEFLDDVRAVLDDGNIVFRKEPIYHDDPVRPEQGALVYTIFSLEMLVHLRRIGFHTTLYRLHSPLHGILGPNAIVFEAVKH